MLIMWYRNLFIKITYMYSSLLKRRLQRVVLRTTAAPSGRGAARGPDPAAGDPGRRLPRPRPAAGVGLRPGAHRSPPEAAGGLPGSRGRKPAEGMTARTAPRGGEHPASKLFWKKRGMKMPPPTLLREVSAHPRHVRPLLKHPSHGREGKRRLP